MGRIQISYVNTLPLTLLPPQELAQRLKAIKHNRSSHRLCGTAVNTYICVSLYKDTTELCVHSK